MYDELHAARLVEEALQNDGILGRQTAQRRSSRTQVFDDLLGRRLADADRIDQPTQRALAIGCGFEPRKHHGAKARHRHRQLVTASRCLAEPEWDAGWRAV